MTSELLLLVCAANVCRSPLAELLLRRDLVSLSDVRIESAGTKVAEAAVICAAVGDRESGAEWLEAGGAHRSRAVTEELLAEAALILVSDREVRSDVVATLPEARDRVFTFLDAARSVEEFSSEPAPRHAGVVTRFATHLDGRRAVRGPEVERRSLFRGRREVDRSSIEDGHGHSARAHERSLRAVSEAMAVIAAGIGAAQEDVVRDI